MGLYRSLCQRKASAWIRLASLALSAFLLSQLIFSPGAWAAESSYSDTRGEECEDAVALLSEKGVINGYEDGTFRPDHQITRAEVAKIFSSLIVGEDTEIVLSEDADLSGLVFPSEEEGKSPRKIRKNLPRRSCRTRKSKRMQKLWRKSSRRISTTAIV